MIATRTILIIWLLLTTFLCVAQSDAKQDSLLQIAATTTQDSVKVRIYLDVAKLYHTEAEAFPWIDKAMALSKSSGYRLGVANSLTNYNMYLFQKGQHEDVLRNCDTGIAIAKPLGAHKTVGVLYNYIANVHLIRGEHKQALQNYLLALDEIKQSDAPPRFRVVIEGNIVKLYGDLRQFDKSLETGLSTIAQAKTNGLQDATSYIYQSVAIAYKERDEVAKCKAYWDTCLILAQRTEDAHLEAAALSNIADLASDDGNRQKAMDYYNRSIAIARDNDDKEIEMWDLSGIASEHYYRKDWEMAYQFAEQAKDLAEANKYREYLTNIYLLLSDIDIARGRLQEGAAWRLKWQKLRTELTNETTLRATKELETQYQTKEKQNEIDLLTQQQKLQQLNLRQQKIFIWGFAILFVMAAAIGLIYYRLSRQKQQMSRQSLQLQEQKIVQLEQEKQLSAANGILQGQEEERGRLARDIHDGLGGMLSGVKSMLTAMNNDKLIDQDASAPFGKVMLSLDNSIDEMRRVARNLMPEALLRFGLKDALRDYCENFAEKATFRVQFQAFGMDTRLPQQTEIIVFRIVQELLNNIQKHAAATEVIVQLIGDPQRLHVTVEDNGKGFDTGRGEQKGVGLISIESRVAYLHGNWDIKSEMGKGTMIDIEIPVNTTA